MHVRLSIITGVALTLVATPAYADIELAPIVVIDFSEFEGTGFNSSPEPGQLDSDDWSIVFGEGGYQVPFGGTSDGTNDYSRGYGLGGTDTVGIWAFDVDGAGLIALGVQPSTEAFTPGRIAMRLVNNTGAEVSRIQVAYNIWVNNDVDAGNSFDLQHSADNVTYTAVGSGFVSPGLPDVNGFTATDMVHEVMPAAPIANGSQYYLAWAGDEVIDGSYADEFGLEGITLRLLEICGNGLVEKDETCDDANPEDGDGCAANCLLEDETTSSGGDETTAGESESGSASASDTVADTSGDSDASVTATDASMSASASGSVTDASATTVSATGGSDTDDGESSGGTGEDNAPSGCSCTTSSNASGWGLLGLFALARRRRRSRR